MILGLVGLTSFLYSKFLEQVHKPSACPEYQGSAGIPHPRVHPGAAKSAPEQKNYASYPHRFPVRLVGSIEGAPTGGREIPSFFPTSSSGNRENNVMHQSQVS